MIKLNQMLNKIKIKIVGTPQRKKNWNKILADKCGYHSKISSNRIFKEQNQ